MGEDEVGDGGGWSDPPGAGVSPDAGAALLDRVVAAGGMRAVVAAGQYRAVDELRQRVLTDAKRPDGPGVEMVMRSLRLELALALTVTESTAAELIAYAEALVCRYPAVLTALKRAEITERHIRVLVDGADSVDDEVRDEVATRGLELAREVPFGSFRRALRKLVDTLHVSTLPERHTDALRHRRVAVEQTTEGMAWLTLFIPAVEAHAVYARATGMAKVILAGNPDDTRTLDQTRADVLSDLLIDGQAAAHPDTVRGMRATVAVTVPALSLLSDEQAATDPAVVEGLGPIPVERARELAGSADGWMRVLTHPETGMVLSVSRDHTDLPHHSAAWCGGGPPGAWPPDAGSPPTGAKSTTNTRGNTAATPHYRT